MTAAVWAIRAQRTYDSARGDLQAVQTDARIDLSTLTLAAARRDHADFLALQGHLDALDRLTRLPRPAAWTLRLWSPAGRRYEADRQLLAAARELAAGGVGVTGIAADSLAAFEQTGFTGKANAASPTWLDVLYRQQGELVAAVGRVERARAQIEALDKNLLPSPVRARLPALDSALGGRDLTELTTTALPQLFAGLGAAAPVNYLVLIENPEELRPSGGFPGTLALVTLSHGQLASYAFFDIYDLNQAYAASDHPPVPQPWPLATYAPTGELSMLDATWWADFPTSAQTLLAMYRYTGWPPVNGVVAIDPAVVGRLLAVTGPQSIDIDGERRSVDSQNFLAEIERERRLAMSGQKSDLAHKQMVALVGRNIIAQLQGADRPTLQHVIHLLGQAADRRDIQAYATDAGVEQFLDGHRWTGRLVPDRSTPTLAITMANVAFGKSSQLMQPVYAIDVRPAPGDAERVTLKITLQHTGTANPSDPFDAFYQGTQRWWIDVALPASSTLLGSSVPRVPDPGAAGGGAYLIALDPGQTAALTLSFEMPQAETFLIRRQPGLQPADLTLTAPGCAAPARRTLNTDQRVSLARCG